MILLYHFVILIAICFYHKEAAEITVECIAKFISFLEVFLSVAGIFVHLWQNMSEKQGDIYF